VNKTVKYNYFHWGPFLYKTVLELDELKKIKKLCSKKSQKHNNKLAGLIKHEHTIDSKKILPIIYPYIQSYTEVYPTYGNKDMGNKIELVEAWVNYMTKFESNPLHTHGYDLSFVIYTHIPKALKKEMENNSANTNPGEIFFIYSLNPQKYDTTQHSFIPKAGDFFIFPASLHHKVNHFQSKGERISISGNLKITNG
jgi:hypothetical protein